MRQTGEHGRQVRMRFEAVRLGRFDERVQCRAGARTWHGVAEQPAFSADDKRADRILAAVVVQRDVAVLQEREELR